MDISVVIPFYNGEEFFEETLNSILSQTVSIGEIIIVNDGCGKKLIKFLEQFKGLTIIDSPVNLGVSSARNLGIKRAKYDWIAFCDADDIWEPNKIELQIDFLTQHSQFSACHTGIETFNSKGKISQFIDKPFDLELSAYLICCHMTPPSLLIKKSALECVNYFDSNMKCAEDYDLSIRLLKSNFKIGFLKLPLTRVRRMNHRNIYSSGHNFIKGHLQLLRKHRGLFKSNKGSEIKFIYKTYMTAGHKSHGLEKNLYYVLGTIIALIFRIKN